MPIQIKLREPLPLRRLDKVEVRPWRATTDKGVPCVVYVYRIHIDADADRAEFERELFAELAPRVSQPF